MPDRRGAPTVPFPAYAKTTGARVADLGTRGGGRVAHAWHGGR
jgi:hypothetical protein